MQQRREPALCGQQPLEADAQGDRALELDAFVGRGAIGYAHFDKPYMLVPGKRGEKGYVLLREALRRADMVGIARVVIRTRQYVAALVPEDDALLLILMRYQQELRSPQEFDLPRAEPSEYGVSEKEIAMADQLIESMREEWRPERYRDEYRDKLVEWIELKAREGRAAKRREVEPEEAGAEVTDMMDLLRKSLATKQAETGPRKKAPAPRGSRRQERPPSPRRAAGGGDRENER